MRRISALATLVLAGLCATGGTPAWAQEALNPTQQPVAPTIPGGVPSVDDLEQILADGPQGKLAVHALQGTQDGPAVGAVDVAIDLYHNNSVIKQISATLDENSVVVLEDIPLAIGVRPVVRIEHAGVTYLEIGPTMTTAQPEAVVKVTVYETTDEAPPWHISMRHVMIQRIPEGLHVGETMVVENPADQTWLGHPEDEQGQRNTVEIRLPEGAHDVRLEAGFHGWCCTALEGRDLAVQMPLMPGEATFRYSYHVAAEADRAEIMLGASAPTDTAVFFVPIDGSTVDPVGLDVTGDEQMGETMVRMYQGASLAKGQDAGLIFAGLSRPAPGAPAAATTTGASSARAAALVGGALIVVTAGIILVFRTSRRPETDDPETGAND